MKSHSAERHGCHEAQRSAPTDSFHCATTIIVAGAHWAARPPSPLLPSVIPMAAVAQGPSERDGAYYQDAPYEPDLAWKKELRRRISEALQPLVDEARKEKEMHYVTTPTNDYEHTNNENVKHTYEVKMTRIRRKAQEQFDAEMQYERQLRRLAAGAPPDDGWSESLLREQQSLWDATRKANKSQDRASSRLAFGGSANAVAGPSRIGLDGYAAGDGPSSVRYDSVSGGFDDTTRYPRWAHPAQPQPRRDGTIPSD
ncbi:uncharacterized protein B0H18DRAFT_997980 [Fomitopsis serialis]|uniref:uncharacterized protein n=1 Tax=Fomitopsis serialis TaxID=139415 RepID=UPI00200772B5|nr:uncharacterized protein B0H18DRAFT_997980 [Neoantrodia serialis]KAH9929187.1 hypothetical protein B0H18DRAFT_997980 [Neoantrodia serialis]